MQNLEKAPKTRKSCEDKKNPKNLAQTTITFQVQKSRENLENTGKITKACRIHSSPEKQTGSRNAYRKFNSHEKNDVQESWRTGELLAQIIIDSKDRKIIKKIPQQEKKILKNRRVWKNQKKIRKA